MQDTEHCSECQEKFDGSIHAPRDIGCGPYHYMCLKCLKDHLYSEQKKIECYLHEPQDKIIDLRYKTIYDFPAVEPTPAKGTQTFCTQHGNMDMTAAKFICMECPAKICLACSQEHMKIGHAIVPIDEISNKKEEIENSIMNKFEIIEEAKLREKDYEDRKGQFEKSINDEADKCIKEFQSQIDFVKSTISAHLSNVHRTFQKEFAFIEKEYGPWREDVLENVKKHSKEDQELALRNLYREQKTMNEYGEKMTKQIQAYQKEMGKISVNFSQKFSEFIKKELFTELNLLENNKQQEEKVVRFNMENGYKPFNKDEAIDLRSSIRSQINPPEIKQRERGRSRSNPRDNRDRSGSKNKDKFEENKLSDSQPPSSNIRRPSNSNDLNQPLGLDHLADSIKQSLQDFGIPLTVENNGGLVVKTVNTMHKSSINNEIANSIQQFFVNRPIEELNSITQVEFICSGLDGFGVTDIGNTILSFKNLTSLSIKFAKSEDMTAKDLTILEKAFPKLDRLRSLKISFARWKGMTDNSLLIFLENLSGSKNLKTLELDFAGCFKLRDEGVNKGIISLSSLAHLEKLAISVAECPDVTYNCTAQLRDRFDRMKNLKQVNIDFGKGTPSRNIESFYYEKDS